jgi:hypothetical protein
MKFLPSIHLRPFMIPRHQAILLLILFLASLGMGIGLWHLRETAHERMIAGMDSAPTRAPQVAPVEQATLLVANDADDSLIAQVHSLPLLDDPGSRARAVLGKLLDLYAAPDSTHAVPGGASSVAGIFLLPASGTVAETPKPAATGRTIIRLDLDAASIQKPQQLKDSHQGSDVHAAGPLLAVVNLTGSFAASHPSGLEVETLTVQSICATLHANLPRVIEVRFLVDGQSRPTLAGHADLTRMYIAGDAGAEEGIHP